MFVSPHRDRAYFLRQRFRYPALIWEQSHLITAIFLKKN